MPRAEARCLTASSRGLGRRILSCADFLSNSNLTGVRPERSYSDKSAVSTNRSASSSLLKIGIFLFIAPNLLPVHVTGGNGADQALSATLPDGEDQEDRTAARGFADCPKPVLVPRVRLVGNDQHGAIEQCFDLGGRYAVLQAFCAIA